VLSENASIGSKINKHETKDEKWLGVITVRH